MFDDVTVGGVLHDNQIEIVPTGRVDIYSTNDWKRIDCIQYLFHVRIKHDHNRSLDVAVWEQLLNKYS